MIIKIKKAHSVFSFREKTRKKSLQPQSNSSDKPDYNSYDHSFISSYGWDTHWSTCFYILDWFEREEFSRQVQQNVAIPVLLLLTIGAIQLNFMGTLANKQLKREAFVQINPRSKEPISSSLTRGFLEQTLTKRNTVIKQEVTRKKRGFAIEKSTVDESTTNLQNAQQEHQELITELETLNNTTLITTQEQRDLQMKGQHEIRQRIEANQTNITRLNEKLRRDHVKKVHTLNAIIQLEKYREQLNAVLKESQKQLPVQYVESWLFNSFATNYHSMVNENIQIIKDTINYSQQTLPSVYEKVLTHIELVKSTQRSLTTTYPGLTNQFNQLEAWKNSVNNSKNVVEESFKDCLDMIKQYEIALANYSLEIAYDKSQILKHENAIDGTHEQFIETITHLQTQLKQLDRKVFQLNSNLTRIKKNLQTDFKETLASLDREFIKNTLLEYGDDNFARAYLDSQSIMYHLNKFGDLLNCIELNKQCLLELKTVCSQDISASEFSNSKLIQALVQHMNLEEYEKLRNSFLENENKPPAPKKLKLADSLSDFPSTLPSRAQVILSDFQQEREAGSSADSLSLNEMLTHLEEEDQKSEDQKSEDLNLESRSSMDSFKNKLDEQTDSSLDSAAKIWSFFSKNFWAQYDEAIKKAKQEQKDYLLKLIENQTLLASQHARKVNVPFTTPSSTLELPVSERLEQELLKAERTLAKSYNENVGQLMHKVINSQNVEGNSSSMNPNTSMVSTSSSIRKRVFNLVYKMGEFTTKGLIMARLYEPIFYQAKSVLYQEPFESLLPSYNLPTQTQSQRNFRQLNFDMSSSSKLNSKKPIINVHTASLNPFSQLYVTRTNLDPLHSTVPRPLPVIGFHHNHYYAIEFKNKNPVQSRTPLSRGDIPVVREDQFLRFIGGKFTSDWLSQNSQFRSAIQKKDYARFSNSLDVSQYQHQNRTINNQLDRSLSPFIQQYQAPTEGLDRITEIAKMDQENPERKEYLETLQKQIHKFGRAYQKVASFPIFQLGSKHYHKYSKSDTQATRSDNFFQRDLQPFISDKTRTVDFLELLSKKYFQGIEDSQRTKNTITNFIKNHVMPLSPYAPKPEQAAPNQTPEQANGFIFHNLETDQYQLCRQSKVYQDIQGDLMRVERVLQMRDDTLGQNPKSRTEAQDFSKLYTAPLYHPLFTPYLVDATTSELMHILKNHRFPGVPNLTQPFRASRFEFNVHLDECARHIQHQTFFEELGNLLVREDYVQRTGPKKKAEVELRNRTQIQLREHTLQEEIKRAYRFHEYVLPSHLLTIKTIIISHILLALKYSIQFCGTIPS